MESAGRMVQILVGLEVHVLGLGTSGLALGFIIPFLSSNAVSKWVLGFRGGAQWG